MQFRDISTQFRVGEVDFVVAGRQRKNEGAWDRISTQGSKIAWRWSRRAQPPCSCNVVRQFDYGDVDFQAGPVGYNRSFFKIDESGRSHSKHDVGGGIDEMHMIEISAQLH